MGKNDKISVEEGAMIDIDDDEITIDLDEKDVHEDLVEVVNYMSKLRVETLTNEKVNEKDRDKYLHATYRLASVIEGLADDNLVKRLDKIYKHIGKDDRLKEFDYSQENYWKKHNKDFIDTLDDLTVSVLRNGFSNVDSKHHVFQAIKFLGVADSPFDEKEKVYDTLLPFNGRVKGLKTGWGLSGMASRILGYSYKVEEEDELKIRLSGNMDFLDDVLEEVGDIGYTGLKMDMYKSEFDEYSTYYDMKMIEPVDEPKTLRHKLLPFNLAELEGRKKFSQQLIKWTTPLSYPLLGLMSEDMQKRLEEYTSIEDYSDDNRYKPRYGFNTSNWVEFAGGIAMGAGSWIYTGRFLNPGTIAGICMAVEGGIRGLWATEGFDKEATPKASVPAKVALWPLELYLQKREGGLMKRGDYCRVEFKVKNRIEQPKEGEFKEGMDCFKYLCDLVELEVPENIASNLKWDVSNHHNFANDFADYFDRQVESLKGNKPNLNSNVDKENQMYTLFESIEVGDYTRFTSLACAEGGRQVVSFVGKTKNLDDDYMKKVNGILASDKSIADKAVDITKQLKTNYTHILGFENGELDERYVVN